MDWAPIMFISMMVSMLYFFFWMIQQGIDAGSERWHYVSTHDPVTMKRIHGEWDEFVKVQTWKEPL